MKQFRSHCGFCGALCNFGILLCFNFLAISCQNVSPDSGFAAEGASCQSCHLSPPPSGMHEYHLLDQKTALKISCKDCHSTAIDSVSWVRNIIRNYPRNLGGLQKITTTEDSLYLERILFREQEYKLCEARISADSLYTGNLDSMIFSGISIKTSDSLVWTDLGFKLFPLDTIFSPNDSSFSTARGKPRLYDYCSYRLRGKEIYERIIGPLNNFLAVIPKADYVIDSSNSFILARIPNLNQVYKQEFYLVSPEAAPLNLFPDSILQKFITKIQGKGSYFLKNFSGSYMQIEKDSLYSLLFDSTMDYSNPLFANTTEYHANGKLDIHFEKAKFTDYKEQLSQVEVDNITADTLRMIYKTIGAWNPVKKTCWSPGIFNSGACHSKSSYETPWYPEKMTLTPP